MIRALPGRALWLRLLLGILLGVLVGELAVRAYFAIDPNPPADGFIRDDLAGYRMRPEADFAAGHDGHINAYGYRGREYPIGKPVGVQRVLGIGDSFVYGSVAMEDNFLRVAEREISRLRTRAEDQTQSQTQTQEFVPIDSVQVCLFGAPGYSPPNYVGVARNTVERLDPDLVVLCFFIGNDVTGIPVRGEVLGGRLYFRGSSSRWHRLLRKSALFLVAERVGLSKLKERFRDPAVDARIDVARSEREPAAAADLLPESVSESNRETTPEPNPPYLLFQSRRLTLYELDPDPEQAVLWTSAERALREFDQVCRRAGVPWLLFLIPTEMQVDPDVRAGVLKRLGRETHEFDFGQPQRRVREFARVAGIQVVDPLGQFRAVHAEAGRLYLPNDTHWNERGNHLAGTILARAIESELERSEGVRTVRPTEGPPAEDER